MKVKQITTKSVLGEESSSMANTSGKIVANDGKTITVAMPDGTQIQKPITPDSMATDPQGKPVLNLATQPNSNVASGQQPQDMFAKGKDVNINTGTPIEEEPAPGGTTPPANLIPSVNTSANPPLVMDVNNSRGTPLRVTKSGEEITPALVAKSAPDWQEAYIKAGGKTYTALKTGNEYRVGKQAYQAIVGTAARTSAPVSPAAQTSPPSRVNPGQPAPARMPTRESADDQLLNSMLTIAGLR